MKYALGNMLNGGGGLNPDGLSLDLQFAADKTLTARRGPTPDFTRGSTATFVGSDGLIQSAFLFMALERLYYLGHTLQRLQEQELTQHAPRLHLPLPLVVSF
jgi:hypothetical protein